MVDVYVLKSDKTNVVYREVLPWHGPWTCIGITKPLPSQLGGLAGKMAFEHISVQKAAKEK